MDKQVSDLRLRTRKFALRIIRLCIVLPKSGTGGILSGQLLRSGTSVGAHYAESFRSKSKADFVSKIEGATQELEESIYWLHLLVGAEFVKLARLRPLLDEAEELMAIFVTMATRTKQNLKRE
jgi:four helix bundle protein